MSSAGKSMMQAEEELAGFDIVSEYEVGELTSFCDAGHQAIRVYFDRDRVFVKPSSKICCSETVPHRVKKKCSKFTVFRACGRVLKELSIAIDAPRQECASVHKAGACQLETQPISAIEGSYEWLEIPQESESYQNEQELLANGADVIVDDAIIVSAMNIETYAAKSYEEVLFKGGEPHLADIRQNDKISTCYLLAAMAAYLCSDIGKAVFKGMFSPVGDDGGVTVELYEPALKRSVRVKVRLSRLFHKEMDLLSCASTNTLWPSIFEKAFYGINLALKQCFKEMRHTGDGHQQIRSLLVHALDEEGNAKFHFDNLLTILHRLPCVHIEEVEQNIEPTLLKLDVADFSRIQALIEINLAMGVPIIAATRKFEGGLLRKLEVGAQALVNRIPTAHAIAMIRVVTVRRGDKEESGVLVFDPYGEACGKVPVDQMASGELEFTETVKSPLQFVSWSMFFKCFQEVAMARGWMQG